MNHNIVIPIRDVEMETDAEPSEMTARAKKVRTIRYFGMIHILRHWCQPNITIDLIFFFASTQKTSLATME